MHRVTRPPTPPSLAAHADDWTTVLLEQLTAYNNVIKDVPEKFKSRYRRADVKEALEQMYDGRCCYCESQIGVTDYEHIEHLRPKTRFPELWFDWENLHWACPKCNIAKSSKWNDEHPIVDPTVDNPAEHLSFDSAIVFPKSKRGDTTIEHAQLNRRKLARKREKIAARVYSIIQLINRDPNLQHRHGSIDRLSLFTGHDDEFPTMIQLLIDEFLQPV